jgi:hypothetical protein
MNLLKIDDLEGGRISLLIQETYLFGLIKIEKRYIGTIDVIIHSHPIKKEGKYYTYYTWFDQTGNLIVDVTLLYYLHQFANFPTDHYFTVLKATKQ